MQSVTIGLGSLGTNAKRGTRLPGSDLELLDCLARLARRIVKTLFLFGIISFPESREDLIGTGGNREKHKHRARKPGECKQAREQMGKCVPHDGRL